MKVTTLFAKNTHTSFTLWNWNVCNIEFQVNTLVQYSLEGGNATVLCLCKYFKMHCRLEVECIAGQSNRSQHLVCVTRPRPARFKHQRRILTTVICHKDQTCKSEEEYFLLLHVTRSRLCKIQRPKKDTESVLLTTVTNQWVHILWHVWVHKTKPKKQTVVISCTKLIGA